MKRQIKCPEPNNRVCFDVEWQIMIFLLLKAVPVMRGWEDVRDEMVREPIRKLKPQSHVPQVAEGCLHNLIFMST